jgi:hypothetical protein
MLSQEDKNKILALRAKNFSYEAIHEQFGFAKDTIMKVCREYEENKTKEFGKGNSGKFDADQLNSNGASYDSVIQEIQNIESNIGKLIKSGRLKANDKRVWEHKKENIRSIVREEADDVKAAAIEKRDSE